MDQKEMTFVFPAVPDNAGALSALPEASLLTPFQTAALSLLALLSYERNPETAYAMLDFLKGPETVSVYEKQFLRDRLQGKAYVVRSFFHGASPENGYTPSRPFTITVSAGPYSFSEENWAVLYVKSSGADSPRPVKLRRKPSTGQWFLNELQCLASIRLPAEEDPWA